MRMRKLIAWLLACCLLLGCCPALAESGEPRNEALSAADIALTLRPEAQEPTQLVVGNTTRVSGDFFTSQFGNNTSDIDVRAMIHGYSLVVWRDQLTFAEDPQVVAGIRKSFAGGDTVYTVTLRPDLTWNDGTPITAADYVFSVLLMSSPEFASLGADTGMWSHIVGYDDYAGGLRTDLEGVRLVDDLTLSIRVKGAYEPYFYELSYLAINPYPISVLAPGCCVTQTRGGAAIMDAEDPAQRTVFTEALLAETVLGDAGYLHQPTLTCGPYNLTGYDAASGTVTFAKNPCYKGNHEGVKPWIDTVTLVCAAQDTMIDDMLDGRIDLLNKVVSGEAIMDGRTRLTDGFRARNYVRMGYGFLTFSCEQGPQQSTAVRQAVACCLDAEDYTRTFLKGLGYPVYGYYGLGQWMLSAINGNIRPTNLAPEDEEAWAALSLDGLDPYAFDLNRAERLLVSDGWTLNKKGTDFRKGEDTVRYKDVDGTLVPLRFTFALCENNAGAAQAADMLSENLPKIGAELIVKEVTFEEVLADHYRADSVRRYDMSFMATNFVSTFDPYMTLTGGTDADGAMNTSGLMDEELLQLAWELHITEPMDLVGYMHRWIAFQQRYNELLPTLPIYSNVYFDFHTDRLQNYYINTYTGWPSAILYAYLDDPAAQVTAAPASADENAPFEPDYQDENDELEFN